jgi:hypothetical protein
MNDEAQRRVSWWMGPQALLVGMPIAAIMWLALTLMNRPTTTQIWQSLLLGFVLGLPGALVYKAVMRKHLDFFVEFSLRPIPKGSSAASLWKRLLYGLPFLIPMEATFILGLVYLHEYGAGVAVVCMLWLLSYPEYALAYQAARQQIGQS